MTLTRADEHQLDLVVSRIDHVADAVVALTLTHPDGVALPAWQPGAHIDLVLDDLVRQYSLCGDPSDTTSYTVAVLREEESRGGSAYVHDRLTVGDHLTAVGPRNHFEFIAAARYVFIAGGIGITPLLAMIGAADSAGADWQLWYRGRQRAGMAFTSDLDHYGDRVHVLPGDETGPLDLAAVLAAPTGDTAVYVCGPERLLEAVEQICTAHWPPGSLHLERFAPKQIEGPEGGERSFEVVLASTGLTLTVPPDKSIFHVIEDAGIPIPGSCHEGICGTCETFVLEGQIDHRDSLLNEAERAANDAMMVCVSRSLSDRLVLDL